MNNKPQGGLGNLGNTCYINSTLACLQSCPQFKQFILSKSWDNNIDKKFIDYFYDLAVESWKNKYDIIPYQFMSFLKTEIYQIDIFSPNDIHEFINLFINKIHTDIAKPLSNVQKYEILISKEKKKSLKSLSHKLNLNWISFHSKEWSPIVDLFWGQNVNQIICGNCNKIFHNYETFDNIMLSIDNSCFSLLQCIENHYSNETLNEWKCDSCKQKSSSIKTTKLWRLPKILIVSLKRFDKDLKKNSRKIDIAEYINFDRWCIKSNNDTYQLSSIANHIGDFTNGHYMTIGKYNDKWWKIDDLSCNIINSPNISNGYVYFYTKISDDTKKI